jgi:hypothetical protein
MSVLPVWVPKPGYIALDLEVVTSGERQAREKVASGGQQQRRQTATAAAGGDSGGGGNSGGGDNNGGGGNNGGGKTGLAGRPDIYIGRKTLHLHIN